MKQGLGDNQVRCIHFDAQGFMWLGTTEGLDRFDGESFTHHSRSSNSPEALCGNVINDVIHDADGNLWIASRDGGICKMNTWGKVLEHPILWSGDSTQVNMVNKLFFTTDSLLYASTVKGMFIAKQPYDHFELSDTTHVATFFDLFEFQRKVYCSTVGIAVGEITKNGIETRFSNEYLASGYILQCFYPLGNGQWLSGGWDPDLHLIDMNKNVLENIRVEVTPTVDKDDEIICITENAPGKFWLGWKSGQLMEYDASTKNFQWLRISQEDSKTLNGSRIFCMHTDHLGRTWIGTDAGLHVYNPFSAVFEIDWLPDRNATVNDLASFQNRLAISTTKGLYVQDNDDFEFVPLSGYNDYAAYALLEADNVLWVGTTNNVARYTGHSMNDHFIHHVDYIDGLTSTRINALLDFEVNGHPYLFINPYGHGTFVGSIEERRWAYGVVFSDGNMENLVRKIFRDSYGNIWFAGAASGLNKLVHTSFENKPFPIWPWKSHAILGSHIHLDAKRFSDKEVSNEISGICEASGNKLWLATMGSGLVHFDPNAGGKQFSKINDSPNSVKALIADDNGRIWLIATGGLHSFDTSTGLWKHYSEQDGIPAAGLSQAMIKLNGNNLIAGGNGFLMRWNPDKILANPEIPKTVITGFDIHGITLNQLLAEKTIVLNPDQNFITIHFSSLCYNKAEDSRFEYILEGLDNHWRSAGNVNFVDFNDLPFGEFIFKVRATNADGKSDDGFASLRIHIRTPFFRSWFFIHSCIVCFAFVIYAVFAYRRRQRLRLDHLRNKIARDLHDDVGSALGSISLYSEAARRTLSGGNQQATEFVLDKMGSTSREMIEKMHDIVWAVNPENDSMEQVIERMQNHINELKTDTNPSMEFKYQLDIVSLKLDMNARKNIFLIFKEAIYNSLKHAQSHKISIDLIRTNLDLVMVIQDDGIGFDIEQIKYGGNGLKNMNARAEEIGASLIIISNQQGTRLVLTSPLVGMDMKMNLK